MIANSQPRVEEYQLELNLGSSELPVSNLSSMLRVVQAALRSVARGNDDTRQPFSESTQPVLKVSSRITEGNLALRFTFVDPADSSPLPQLSSVTFGAFLDQLSQHIQQLPQQRDLWGASVGGPHRGHDSELARRLDQVCNQLRRFPRATLRFDDRTIRFERDRIEFG